MACWWSVVATTPSSSRRPASHRPPTARSATGDPPMRRTKDTETNGRRRLEVALRVQFRDATRLRIDQPDHRVHRTNKQQARQRTKPRSCSSINDHEVLLAGLGKSNKRRILVVEQVRLWICAGHRGLATRSEWPQTRNRTNPRHREMDTSRVDGVKAPLHNGTPRSHQRKPISSSP